MTDSLSSWEYPGSDPRFGYQQDPYRPYEQPSAAGRGQRQGTGKIRAFQSLKYGFRALKRNFGPWAGGMLAFCGAIMVLSLFAGGIAVAARGSVTANVLTNVCLMAVSAVGSSLFVNQALKEVNGERPGFGEFFRPRHFWGPFVLSLIFSIPAIFSGGSESFNSANTAPETNADGGAAMPSGPDFANFGGTVLAIVSAAIIIGVLVALLISVLLLFWPFALGDGLKPGEAIRRGTSASWRNFVQVLIYELLPLVILLPLFGIVLGLIVAGIGLAGSGAGSWLLVGRSCSC